MREPITSSKQIESFRLSLADIRDTDLHKLHALSLSVSWPHRAEDWDFLRRVGHGLVALDDIGRVIATAMWFPQGPDFATIGMVITSPRLQTHGAGHWLMQHAFQTLEGRDIGLNATRAAERLYLSLRFEPEASVFQHQGEAGEHPPVAVPRGASLRELSGDDLAAVQALDHEAAGYDRGPIIADVLQRSTGFGLFRGDALVAYGLRRAFGRGTLIGPVVASCDDDAIAVVAPHLAASRGDFVRLDTRQNAGDFLEFITKAGLPRFDTVTSMGLGRIWTRPERKPSTPIVYGLITQATG